jgi:O-antigen/teichoic acid export membrane protein
MNGTMKIFLAEALILPTGFITAVFLARSLGPVGYGIFALVSRMILWIEWTCFGGFSGTTVKFIGESSDWRPVGTTSLQLHFIIGICTACVIWFLAPLISSFFHEPAMAGYIRLFSVELPVLGVSSACSNILMGTGRYQDAARIGALRLIARVFLIILFVVMGLSVKGAILGTIGASVVELVISWYYVRPSLFYKSTFPIRRLLGFGAPLFMSELCQRIFRLDLFALKALGGTAAQAGFYGAAMNLTIPTILVSKSLSYPMLSTLSSMLSKGDKAGARKIAMVSIRSILWLIPFAAMTAGASREIAIFIFGDKYLPAGPILSFLILAAIGVLAINVSKTILTALGKPGWTFIIAGPMIPLALAGHLILIPMLGGIGAAIVTASVACMGAVVGLYTVYRIWRVFPPLKTVIISSLCSIPGYVIASMWPTSGFVLILKLAAIVFIILICFFLFGEFTRNELHMIRSLLCRKIILDK